MSYRSGPDDRRQVIVPRRGQSREPREMVLRFASRDLSSFSPPHPAAPPGNTARGPRSINHDRSSRATNTPRRREKITADAVGGPRRVSIDIGSDEGPSHDPRGRLAYLPLAREASQSWGCCLGRVIFAMKLSVNHLGVVVGGVPVFFVNEGSRLIPGFVARLRMIPFFCTYRLLRMTRFF